MSDRSLDVQLRAQRLSVVILGEPEVDLAQDITSIQFCESLTRCKLLEVSINNWGTTNNRVGYKYSGGTQGDDLVHLDANIKLYCDSCTLATGKIVTLAANFPKGSPTTLTFSVDAHRPRQKARANVFTISYGSGLSEFHPVLQSDHSTIQASGIADGSPLLIAGIKLDISGVGYTFDGEYLVTESTHTFDCVHGYRTSFSCVKPILSAA